MERKHDWFEDWFDSDYYHILYKNRDQTEANQFITKLLTYLDLEPGSHVLDLACGKGRHSVFLNEKGFDVTGVDLSANSISNAKKLENEHLRFKVGDMREKQGVREFDAVFNLFTSFGYFDSIDENLETLRAIHQSLKPNGKLVIDFMNSTKALANLMPAYNLERGGIAFKIKKTLENQVISKKIYFSDLGKDWVFEERVQALELADFMNYFNKTGFGLRQVFGDYRLSPYNALNSDRMIFIVQPLP